MKKPIISFILLCFSLSLIGQTKIGFYNKSHGDTIKFSVIDTLLYVESANKNVLLLNIPVRIHGRNFVILKSSRKQFSDAVKKHFGKDTLSDKTEPVLRYKDGTKEICHNEVIIKLRKPAKLEDILREYQYTYTQDSFMSNTYYVRFKGKDTYNIFDIIDKLNGNDSIIYTEPNFIRIMSPYTSDSFFQYQWAIKNTGTYYGGTVGADMDVENAWELSTGNNVKIAIIDEGVQLDHPDLVNNLLPGYDATGNNSEGGPNISNDDAHGTNCAGIAAASANNNIGIAGVAYNAKILPIRVAYENSYPLGSPYRTWITQDSWLAAGINYAYSTGQADILSNSWGGGNRSNTIDAAISSAVTDGRNGKGCVVLFAAGNNNIDSVSYPASNPNVIAVGASSNCDTRKSPTSCDGEYWWGSNYGKGLDIVAPGVKIYTTDLTGSHGYSSTDYNPTFNGTSSATPNAAGVAALILSLRPDYTGTQVRQILESTCDKIGGYTYQANVSGQPNGTWCSDVGYGRVNAYKAVLCVSQYITGSSIVCTGGSVFTLNNRPSGATVSWLHSSNLDYVSGQGTDNYTVRAVDATTYGAGWVKAIVSLSALNDTVENDFLVGLPAPPVILPQYLMVRPNTIVGAMAASPGADYWDWDVGGGTILSGQGTREISIQTSPNCIDSLRLRVTVSNVCGSQPQARTSVPFLCFGGLLVSPNPATQTLTVELTDTTSISTAQTLNESYSVELFDQYNKRVYQRKETLNHFTINVSGYRPGIYYLRVIKGNKAYAKKVIIAPH